MTKLHICQVDTFFAVGSPLGVFLALRNIRIGIGKQVFYMELYNLFLIFIDLFEEAPLKILLIVSLS